jgi:hypothetical protein
LEQKGDLIALTQTNAIARPQAMAIAFRERRMVDVSPVRTPHIFEVVNVAFNANIGVSAGDNFGVGKPGNINIWRNLIVGFANVNHRQVGGQLDFCISLQVK